MGVKFGDALKGVVRGYLKNTITINKIKTGIGPFIINLLISRFEN